MNGEKPRWHGIFRQANIADLIILMPFAIPVLSDHYLGLWRMISETVPADRPLGEFGPDAMLFVNLAGAFAVLAVLVRMKLGNVDAARMTGGFKLVAVVIFTIAIMRGASFVFVVPLLADLVIGGLLVTTNQKR